MVKVDKHVSAEEVLLISVVLAKDQEPSMEKANNDCTADDVGKAAENDKKLTG
jgi:hypothetical protein